MKSAYVPNLAFVLIVCGLGLPQHGRAAADPWTEALARMPLRPEIRQLNRTNCVEVMLEAFQASPVVKGLVFMPGATDEFYMFRRAKADLRAGQITLLDALIALTNQTLVRATFRPPLLLLHTAEDSLEPDTVVQDESTATRLRELRAPPHLVCNDRDWDYLEPILRWSLRIQLKPWQNSRDSWHFYRHSFAGWNLSGWEALEAAALAGKSKFTVRRKEVVFETDRRIGVRADPIGR